MFRSTDQGEVRVSYDKDKPIVKGKFKLKVYPGQLENEVARNIFELLIEK